MAIKTTLGAYRCSYCGLEYDDPFRADECRDKHDLVYLQLSVSDFNKLMHFIYSQNEEHLSKSLMDNLRKTQKVLALRNQQDV
jgi:hypothetical protein